MSRFFSVAIVLAALAGCVSTKNVPLKKEALAAHQAGTASLTVREKPSFSAMTAGKAMFGMIGAAAMISAGNALVKENEVEDPAGYIGSKLLDGLASENALTVVPANGAIAKSNEPKELAKLYPQADVLLDVQTINWSLVYFPTDWNSYRVIYSAKLRVIDRKKGTLLADGFCARVPDQTPQSPSYAQLTDNKAAGLKQELMIAADFCVNEFRNKVLTN
jgi:hypothetical protein